MKLFQKYVPVITIIVLVAAWGVASAFVEGGEFILPAPWLTLKTMGKVFATQEFYAALLGSVSRTIYSFLTALFLALLFGVLSSLSKTVERALYPIILIVRATPTMSVIFLCLIWFSSKLSPMLVAIAVIFPTLYTSVLSAIKSCDEDLIEMAKVYKVPTKIMVKKLYLPWVAQKVFDDAVGALSFNVKLIVAAEALAQTADSLGTHMQSAKSNLETATLFAYTVAAVFVSFLLELLLKGIRGLYRRIKDAKSC